MILSLHYSVKKSCYLNFSMNIPMAEVIALSWNSQYYDIINWAFLFSFCACCVISTLVNSCEPPRRCNYSSISLLRLYKCCLTACLFFSSLFCLHVLATEGSSRGGDASDVREEPASSAEAQPVVLGRGASHQHSQHASRYFDHLFPPEWTLDITESVSGVQICPPAAVFALKLFTSPALCCYCWLTPCSASPSLSPLLSNSFSHSPLCSPISLFCLSAIVLSLPGPGFVESALLYPLDLAGLEHMQSAFSLYRRYGMTSQCEYYYGSVSPSQPVLDL